MSSTFKPVMAPGKENKRHFFQEIKGEFTKISWTTKEELIFSTKMVVIATIFFGLGVYVIELCIRGALGFLGLIAKFIGG